MPITFPLLNFSHLFKASKTYLLFFAGLAVALFLINHSWQTSSEQELNNYNIVSAPKIDDIYFLDFRHMSNKLRPGQKYRIAKVVDITGDIVSLKYGSFFYKRHLAAHNTIRYGQLMYKDYFEPNPHNFHHEQLMEMLDNGVIYLAERPEHGKLYGKYIAPEKPVVRSSQYIYGKKEFHLGQAYLADYYSESQYYDAFTQFKQSAEIGFAEGQVSLAEMYVNGWFVEKDRKLAMYWLKQASLQSHKRAIMKYGILCEQVDNCYINDFYRELANSGVNIRVRNLEFKLRN